MKTKIDPAANSLIQRQQDNLLSALTTTFRVLRRGKVDSDLHWKTIQKALQDTIVYNSLEGYRQGAALVGRTPLSATYIRLRRDGEARAEWVAHEMKNWTERSLGIFASKKSKLLSSERANKVSSYESRKAFYDGSQKGWALNKAARKSWLTSDAHDQDDICDDNEDDGIISIDEVFSSGDAVPPAHLNCLCTLWLHL